MAFVPQSGGDDRGWRFLGVDPARAMLDLAHTVAGPIAGDRLTLLEGTVADAPVDPFDGATCILVLGLIADDGGKLDLLKEVRRRLEPDAPFVLVDQCIDRAAPDVDLRLGRYARYALRSGVDPQLVAKAKEAIGKLETMASARRNEELLDEAGFHDAELFYVGMARRGWIAYA